MLIWNICSCKIDSQLIWHMPKRPRTLMSPQPDLIFFSAVCSYLLVFAHTYAHVWSYICSCLLISAHVCSYICCWMPIFSQLPSCCYFCYSVNLVYLWMWAALPKLRVIFWLPASISLPISGPWMSAKVKTFKDILRRIIRDVVPSGYLFQTYVC